MRERLGWMQKRAEIARILEIIMRRWLMKSFHGLSPVI
jgi:hypothetical protein